MVLHLQQLPYPVVLMNQFRYKKSFKVHFICLFKKILWTIDFFSSFGKENKVHIICKVNKNLSPSHKSWLLSTLQMIQKNFGNIEQRNFLSVTYWKIQFMYNSLFLSALLALFLYHYQFLFYDLKWISIVKFFSIQNL